MNLGEKQEPTFGLDPQVFMDVIACGDAGRRTSLSLQIAGFLADPDSPAGEREQVLPAARRLAADEDIEVRRAFADALAPLETLDADLLFAIASDEEEIALPFLASTPALDSLRMLAVLRAGGDTRQAIIATRPDLSQEVIDAITGELSLPVNAMLLENAAARISPFQYRTLYERFGAEREMLELLLARPDLPADLRIIQARRAASNLHELLTHRSWLSASVGAELVVDAEETATVEVLAAESEHELPLAVAFLMDAELLTPSLIVRAACLGHMHVVAACFACLSGLPPRRVAEHMYGKGFKSLHARCDLPQSCYWTLQAACDVSREEHEDGQRLTAEEFGARLIERLLTRYESMPVSEQPRTLDVIGRFSAGSTRYLATRVRADLQRAA